MSATRYTIIDLLKDFIENNKVYDYKYEILEERFVGKDDLILKLSFDHGIWSIITILGGEVIKKEDFSSLAGASVKFLRSFLNEFNEREVIKRFLQHFDYVAPKSANCEICPLTEEERILFNLFIDIYHEYGNYNASLSLRNERGVGYNTVSIYKLDNNLWAVSSTNKTEVEKESLFTDVIEAFKEVLKRTISDEESLKQATIRVDNDITTDAVLKRKKEDAK